MTDDRTITEARIEYAKGLFDLEALKWGGSARVLAKFGDDVEVQVLSYYHDEVTITVAEVVGKTAKEVGALFLAKDVAYLQS